MKRKRLIRVLTALFAFAALFVACGGDDTSDSNGSGSSTTGGGGSISETTQLTSEQQKSKLETIAKEFMTYSKASNFQNVTDLSKYIRDTYSESNYNCDAVDSWWSDCLDAVTTINDSTAYTKNYIRLYMASNFTGHFNANTSSKKWEYTKASNLQFTCKDKSGNTCIATLTTSGSTKKVSLGESSSYTYNWSSNRYFTTNYDNYIMVPEKVNVTLTQNGTTIASIDLTTDLSGMSSTEYDLSKDSYSATCKLTVNDYVVNVSKVAYSTSSASVAMTLSKGSKTLISMNVAANGSVSNSQIQDGDISNVGSANVNVDILGELQVKGTCSSCSKFKTYIDNANENDGNESNFKSYISQVNALIDFGIYYNSSTKQATIVLEPFQKDEYYNKNWYCEPVLKFGDGTSYSTFQAFFDETSFRDVIDNFNSLIEEYKDMVE